MTGTRDKFEVDQLTTALEALGVRWISDPEHPDRGDHDIPHHLGALLGCIETGLLVQAGGAEQAADVHEGWQQVTPPGFARHLLWLRALLARQALDQLADPDEFTTTAAIALRLAENVLKAGAIIAKPSPSPADADQILAVLTAARDEALNAMDDLVEAFGKLALDE